MRLFLSRGAFGRFPALLVGEASRPNRRRGGCGQGPAFGHSTQCHERDECPAEFRPDVGDCPRFTGNPAAAPAACYATVWEPRWQQELGLTAEQKKSLQAIGERAMAETRRHAEEFQKLTPEERAKEAESRGGKAAPWRLKFEDSLRRQIEGVLTPEQLQTIKDDLFPIYAVYALYDAKTREQIGLSPAQTEAFRGVVRERLARGQEESLTSAEEIWALMSPSSRPSWSTW